MCGLVAFMIACTGGGPGPQTPQDSDLRAQIADLRDHVDQLQGQFDAFAAVNPSDRIAANAADIAAHTAAIETNAAATAANSADIAALSETVDFVDASADGIASNVDGIASEVADNAAAVGLLSARIDDLTADLERVRNDTDDNTSAVSDAMLTATHHWNAFIGERGLDSGILPDRTLTFDKVEADTELRIAYFDSFRALGTHASCRWEVLFNGLPCSDPGPLVYDIHEETGSDNHHRSGTVTGFCPATVPRIEIERALIDRGSDLANEVAGFLGEGGEARLEEFRNRLFGFEPPLADEARRRYSWGAGRHGGGAARSARRDNLEFASRRIHEPAGAGHDRAVPGDGNRFPGSLCLGRRRLMDAIDEGTAVLGAAIATSLPDGAFASFVADGVVAGVGSVIVFLPQILILFLFIIVLEDSGYLARAAYLMDRTMRSVGLSGQSIIPMISSFACAVPGIMATRVIPNRRDRIATILAAPFMTCSARLPVYALLIAAFVPQRDVGFLNLQGIVLFGLYMLGIVAGLVTALIMRRTALHGPKPTFALMLPEFRRPNLRTVLMQLLGRAMIFLKRAGTVIFAVAVVVWALAYYPRSTEIAATLEQQTAAVENTLFGESLEQAVAELENEASAAQLEQSWLGRAGKFVAPVFAPLGWDWKISAAVIASFPAREVVVAVLGTVYAVGDEADEATLSERLKSATREDGTMLFTLPMVVGLLIFYACCLQCAATIAVIRRETGSWHWPLFAWTYMTAIGYLGALLAYQLF